MRPSITPDTMSRALRALEAAVADGTADITVPGLMKTLKMDAETIAALMPALERFGHIRRHVNGDHLVIELVASGGAITALGASPKPRPQGNPARLQAYEAAHAPDAPRDDPPSGSFLDQFQARLRRDEDDARFFERAVGAAT